MLQRIKRGSVENLGGYRVLIKTFTSEDKQSKNKTECRIKEAVLLKFENRETGSLSVEARYLAIHPNETC